jgi:hypothetical protein
VEVKKVLVLFGNTYGNYKNEKGRLIYTPRRFETAPLMGAMVQTVTHNLVEVLSTARIEIFNGVNWMLNHTWNNSLSSSKGIILNEKRCKEFKIYT